MLIKFFLFLKKDKKNKLLKVKNSIKKKLEGNFMTHLKNIPLPLPILEFFDFFVKGKFPFKKNQKKNLLNVQYLFLFKSFNNFLKKKKYKYSNLISFEKKNPIFPKVKRFILL